MQHATVTQTATLRLAGMIQPPRHIVAAPIRRHFLLEQFLVT
jgi:hypothetical protein